MRKQTPNTVTLLLLAVLSLALRAPAQIKVGDNLTLSSASGSMGAGYNGSYGNLSNSTHSLAWNGTGTLNGFYYNPSFLSFTFQPYYDQSRTNSNSQSISNSSGVDFSSSIFSGSHFPGSVTYSKAYDSQGTLGVPELPDFTTHGNSDSLGIGWSALVPDWPTLSAQFQLSHSAYTIYGTNDQGTARGISLSLHSSYQLRGFILNGGYSRSVNDSETPLVLTNEGVTTSNGSSSNLNFGVGHRLPMRGNFTASFARYSSDYAYSTNQSTGNNANDSFTTTASIQPWEKVSFSAAASYDDNLGGSITQQILEAGGLVQKINDLPGSHSTSLAGTVNYQARDDLSLGGQVQRRQQTWSGVNLGMTSVTGFARYVHELWGGNLGASMSVSENQEDNQPGMSLGFADSLTYSRQVGAWNVTGGFGYAQNVQSVLISYMTSNYNFGGSVRRRLGPLYWSLSGNAARTGMTVQAGSGSSNETFSTSISTGRHFAGAASYSNSSGTALQTVTGLTPTPLPIPIVNPLLILYSGRSYAFSASSSPVRRLALTATYSHSLSNTLGGTAQSNNALTQFTFSTHYQWRKMYWTAGYSRFNQSISIAGTPASQLSSYYVGIYRWFNFF